MQLTVNKLCKIAKICMSYTICILIEQINLIFFLNQHFFSFQSSMLSFVLKQLTLSLELKKNIP